MNIVISIIIPVYNVEKWLDKCIDIIISYEHYADIVSKMSKIREKMFYI